MRIVWRDQARDDLLAAFRFLLERDPQAALRVRDTIRQKVKLLGDQPGLGRPGRVANTRELVISTTPYIVAYTVDAQRKIVIILRVLHGAQQWPEEL